MADELQTLAQSLATRLHRPVAIDDPTMHLLAHTPHEGPVDDTRLDSILRLQAPPVTTAFVKSFNIASATAAVRLPASEEHNLLARVCAPIRCHDQLLGYVWLLDPDSSLTDEDLREVEQTATSAGLILYRDQLLGDLHRGRQREILRDLVNDDALIRQSAIEALSAGDHLATTGPFIALVVKVASPDGDPEIVINVEKALEHTSRQLPPGSSLFVARADHGILLATHTDSAISVTRLDALASQLAAETTSRTGLSAVVGIGTPTKSLQGFAESCRRARRAIQVAEIVPGFGNKVWWKELGVYRILVQLPLDDLPPDVIHPGLLTLFELDTNGQLVRTLETYLDHAGDLRGTIDTLAIHRTSLYYRLSRIEQISGLNLSDGNERLTVHLGLKLARLSGRYPAVTSPGV